MPVSTYFMPFMLYSRPLPDLVAKRVEVFEISEKDFINSRGRNLELSLAAPSDEECLKRSS